MIRWILLSVPFLLLASCSGPGSIDRTPSEDKMVMDAVTQLSSSPGDSLTQAQFTNAYTKAVLLHMTNISGYQYGSQPDKWERIMKEYAQLNQLAETVSFVPAAAKLVNVKRYDIEYEDAKQNAVESLYSRGNQYLNRNDRQSAMQAFSLFKRADQLIPGYKDVGELLRIANEKSILTIVINPVNYYRHSFDYYGFNNDYMQDRFIYDLRFQLGSAKNVQVFTQQDAFRNNVYPDRVVNLDWNELYMPIPQQSNFTRDVSKQIVTGQTEDKKPIYTTVTATLYITQRIIQARGTLTCRITEPSTNRTVLFESFPGGYNKQEQFATYRGDSRALSPYDLELINNNRFNDPTRNSLFNEVLRQVYPQLLNRIKSATWYS